jgi:hypothetical protein
VWLIFFYIPALISLPAMLVVGVLFVLVPGGFIIILIGLYYIFVACVDLIGMAAKTWLHARRTNPGRASPHSTLSLARRSPIVTFGEDAPISATAAVTLDTYRERVGRPGTMSQAHVRPDLSP